MCPRVRIKPLTQISTLDQGHGSQKIRKRSSVYHYSQQILCRSHLQSNPRPLPSFGFVHGVVHSGSTRFFLLIAPITSDCCRATFLSPRKIAHNVSQKSLSHSPVMVCAASSLPNSSLVLSGQRFSAASLTGGLPGGGLDPEGTSGIPLGSSLACSAIMEAAQDSCGGVDSVTAAKNSSPRVPVEELFMKITPRVVRIFCHDRLMLFLATSLIGYVKRLQVNVMIWGIWALSS